MGQAVMLANGFFLLWSGDTSKAEMCFNLMRQKRFSEAITLIGEGA